MARTSHVSSGALLSLCHPMCVLNAKNKELVSHIEIEVRFLRAMTGYRTRMRKTRKAAPISRLHRKKHSFPIPSSIDRAMTKLLFFEETTLIN
jgi:hypothetical protein